ncbi:MAG: glycosyl transferase, partial [Eubacteriaceae bacterium]|nr:glycosyl transferase [Eubacteriaceae bacterium]
ALGLPFIISLIGRVFNGGLRPDRIKRHIPGFFGLLAPLFQFLLSIVFLPYQALMVLDAVVVTLVRVLITRKNMLVWITSADSDKTQKNSLKSYLSTMGFSMLAGLITVVLAYFFKPEYPGLSLFFLLSWGAAPFIAYFISNDNNYDEEKLEPKDLQELSKIARKTWRYFEEFSNAKNNYLAPDNFQEDPPKGIAYRTSPTNIGLGLLASLSGRDMGYTGILETTDVIEKTITSIEKMEKWEGHLYNWYDTRTLDPLIPLYVSTVDSGNYVCYLVTLVQGLRDYYSRPLVDKAFVKGIKATILNGVEEGEEFPFDFTIFDFMEYDEKIDLMKWNHSLSVLMDWTVAAPIYKQEWKTKIIKMARMFSNELNTFTPWISMMDTMPNEMLENKIWSEKTVLLLNTLKTNGCLKDLPVNNNNVMEQIAKLEPELHADQDLWRNSLNWLQELKETVVSSRERTIAYLKQYHQLIHRIEDLSEKTKFGFLYDDKRQLFSIGYNIAENRLTKSYYDLLASEARQVSYIAIARGDIPARHWSMLGRSLTAVDRYKGLVSWSGTMFEYLMPLLIMKSYRNTLLDETYSFVIKSQKKYGKERKMPWGSSESAYNSLDLNLDYQYKAIGVPWLGLKRGLMEDAVTAPYATFLALLVNPEDAFENIKYLKAEGLEGPYGYYEAADYTPDRLDPKSEKVIIKSFMAHHQGMSLLALNNYLNKNIMQQRFSSDPCVKAARLLLQEKVPVNVGFTKENKEKIIPFKGTVSVDLPAIRSYSAPDPILPKAHILSNGLYSVMVTDKGYGYSRSKTMDITRWREDSVHDSDGMYFYIRNINENQNWSAAYAPLNILPKEYEVVFTPDKASYKRVDGDMETLTEVVVASGDNVEIRRVQLKNKGGAPCVMEVTSYFEPVLAASNSDLAHPAFSKLFVSTEYDSEHHALIANRRPRSLTEKEMWIAEILVTDGESTGDIQYETDRMQFLGRGHTVADPVILERERPLSNTVGSVLDPIFSLRNRVNIEPGKTARFSYVTMIAESKPALLELIEKYSNVETCDASFWLAITRSQVETKYLNIEAGKMELYQNMISDILFISPLRLKYQQQIKMNRKGQPSLWQYGISGDRPMVLLTLEDMDNMEILYEMLKAHEYWRLKDLNVDLVIISHGENSYTNPLYSLITDIIYSRQTHDVLNRRGDVFILNANTMMSEDTDLFYSAARMIFKGSGGSMEEQFKPLPVPALPALLEPLKDLSALDIEHKANKEVSLLLL